MQRRAAGSVVAIGRSARATAGRAYRARAAPALRAAFSREGSGEENRARPVKRRAMSNDWNGLYDDSPLFTSGDPAAQSDIPLASPVGPTTDAAASPAASGAASGDKGPAAAADDEPPLALPVAASGDEDPAPPPAGPAPADTVEVTIERRIEGVDGTHTVTVPLHRDMPLAQVLRIASCDEGVIGRGNNSAFAVDIDATGVGWQGYATPREYRGTMGDAYTTELLCDRGSDPAGYIRSALAPTLGAFADMLVGEAA